MVLTLARREYTAIKMVFRFTSKQENGQVLKLCVRSYESDYFDENTAITTNNISHSSDEHSQGKAAGTSKSKERTSRTAPNGAPIGCQSQPPATQLGVLARWLIKLLIESKQATTFSRTNWQEEARAARAS